ncbi:hypothetical protein LMG27198_44430 [Methylocystis echinoides]|uniref:Uncharacterized protein n=1 Tax=Methylocystis echinoides TaxID=29468 RepID=A0A9W6LUE6_9HYPH|nr:hypothetical protein LMG27198_44430 [Methylocystis echinoides]
MTVFGFSLHLLGLGLEVLDNPLAVLRIQRLFADSSLFGMWPGYALIACEAAYLGQRQKVASELPDVYSP